MAFQLEHEVCGKRGICGRLGTQSFMSGYLDLYVHLSYQYRC